MAVYNRKNGERRLSQDRHLFLFLVLRSGGGHAELMLHLLQGEAQGLLARMVARSIASLWAFQTAG